MRALTLCAALFAALSSLISASNISDLTATPVVLLDNATVLGVNDGITHSFFSIPYGKAPYVFRHRATCYDLTRSFLTPVGLVI